VSARQSQGTFFLSTPDYALALQHYMDIRPLALQHTDPRRCAIRHGRNTENKHEKYHSISGCNVTELNTTRHDQVCATIVDRLDALNVHGKVECNPSVNYRDQDKKLYRPADIVLCKPHRQVGSRILMDVTIVDDTQAVNNNTVGEREPHKILHDRYRSKIDKYSAVLSQAQGSAILFPIVFTGRGQIEENSRHHLQSLFETVKPRFGYNKTVLYHALLDHIVFDLARSVVTQFKAHVDAEIRTGGRRPAVNNDGGGKHPARRA
jgi:hypothetical protein